MPGQPGVCSENLGMGAVLTVSAPGLTEAVLAVSEKDAACSRSHSLVY